MLGHQPYPRFRTQALLSSVARSVGSEVHSWVLVQELPSAQGNLSPKVIAPFKEQPVPSVWLMWRYKGQSPLLSVRPSAVKPHSRAPQRFGWGLCCNHIIPLSPTSSSAPSSDHFLTVFPRALSLKIPICWSQSQSVLKETHLRKMRNNIFLGDRESIKLTRVKVQLGLVVGDIKFEELAERLLNARLQH